VGHDERIVVGVDGSPAAASAVRWAADRADRAGRGTGSTRLHLVHVTTPVAVMPAVAAEPATPLVAALPLMTDAETLERAERTLLESAADVVHRARPGLDVTTERRVGSVAAELLRAADSASLVVLGGRGPGVLAALGDLVLGSVGLEVSTHSPCPTVVVRGAEPGADRGTAAGALPGGGPVVAGVDGVGSGGTVRFAAAEARLSGTRLVVLHSWAQPLPTGAGEAVAAAATHDDLLEGAADEVLRSVVEPLRREHPELPIEARLTPVDAADALDDLSDDAALVVVGSHGYGGLAGLLLGSTSHWVVRHARCPVAVVRDGSSSG
jgi:nucleotide-binding universal stress UspA family protein